MNKIVTIISFLIISVIVPAQEFIFKSYVDQNSITTDEYLRFIVESNERVQLNNLTFRDFIIRQGPYTSSSSQTTIINGKFESKKEYKSTFVLSPKKEGELVIESIKVSYDGKDYTTDRIIINVGKGQKAIQQSNSTKSNSTNNSNSKLFAKISTTKLNPFLGENILISYKIYQSIYHVRNLEVTDYDLPMSNDFWTELIEPKNKQWKEEQETINGIRYSVFTLKKEIISPQKSGKITIPAFEVTTMVNRDFFNRGIQKNLKSNTIVLNVKKLPNNPPPSFNGQVGKNYKLKVNFSKKELNVDDALDIGIEISGNGNLKQLSLPKINYPQDLEKYPEEIKSKINIKTSGISGKKQMSQLLIPRFHGEYEIPKIEFSYFDINSKQYITLTEPKSIIQVGKNNKNSVSITSNPNNYTKNEQQTVALINENIHHIKTKTELYDFSDPIFGSTYYWALIGSIPSSLLLLMFFIYNKDKLTNSDKVHMKKIIKEINQSFDIANKHLNQQKNDSFYAEIYKLWNNYLSNKFKIEIAELNREKINEKLTINGIQKEDIKSLTDILNYCEMAQYSPITSKDAKLSYDQSKLLFNKFEKNA